MFKINKSSFIEFDHTADIGVQVYGESLSAVFANALFAMNHVLYGDFQGGSAIRKSVELNEPSLPDLLVSWLSELNYLQSIKSFLASGIPVLDIMRIGKYYQLTAELIGDDSSLFAGQMQTEIKAVTYHQLLLEQTDEKWHAQIIFDI